MNDERLFDLNDISIATPCSADWAAMDGDDRKRFCGACQKNVYNITAMTESAAIDFLAEEVGNNSIPCIRFYRRADGTILFQDCAVGLKRLKRTLKWFLKIPAAIFMFVFSFGTAKADQQSPTGDELGNDYSLTTKIDTTRTLKGVTRAARSAGFYNGGPDPGTLEILRKMKMKRVIIPSECEPTGLNQKPQPEWGVLAQPIHNNFSEKQEQSDVNSINGNEKKLLQLKVNRIPSYNVLWDNNIPGSVTISDETE